MHPVTIEPDWTITTPHDTAAERVAAAFGSWNSCMQLDKSLAAALRGMEFTMRTANYPVRRHPAHSGRWSVDRSSVMFGSALAAAMYVRSSAEWLAGLTGGLHWQTRDLQTRLIAEFGVHAAVPERYDDMREHVTEPDGLNLLWDNGIHPKRVRRIARRIELGSERLAARDFVLLAYSGIPGKALSRVARKSGDPATTLTVIRDRAVHRYLNSADPEHH